MTWKYSNKNQYLNLVRQFPLIPINSRDQHAEAVLMIKSLALKDGMSVAEGDYFDVLSQLIETYEKREIRQTHLTPNSALNYLMEQNGLCQAEIVMISGMRKSHISEFLAGKRGLPKTAAAKLGARFKVDPMLFLPKVEPVEIRTTNRRTLKRAVGS